MAEIKINNTAIRFYSLSNDNNGKIVLMHVLTIPNKPVRSKHAKPIYKS